MTDDEKSKEREAILARRRFFVASALAGMVTTACTPQPCLNIAEPRSPDAPDGATEGIAGAPGAAGAPATSDDAGTPPVGTTDPPAATDAGGPPPIPPTVCLKVAPPPPHVCLEFAEPPSKK